MQAKIDKFNIIFDSQFDCGKAHCYVPEPSEIELKSLSRVLGYFYTCFQNNENASVMLIDYDRFIDEALEPITNDDQRNRKREQVSMYLERSFMNASFFDEEYSEIPKDKLSKDDVEIFNGLMLFISALYRYSMKEGRRKLIGDYFTSLSVTEWIKSCKKSAKGRQMESSQESSESSGETTQEVESEPTLFVSAN